MNVTEIPLQTRPTLRSLRRQEVNKGFMKKYTTCEGISIDIYNLERYPEKPELFRY